MNFFGHAFVAQARGRDAAFVLGAMLPDLGAMAGLRIAGLDEPVLREGVALHAATDRVFHASARFRALVSAANAALRERGLRRGPALAVSHVAPELVLDGWLARRHGVPEAYRDALAESRVAGARVRWRRSPRAWPFPELCRSLAASDLPLAYGQPVLVAERVARALARRERLALTGAERAVVREWLPGFAREVHAVAEALLDEVDAALGAVRRGEGQ